MRSRVDWSSGRRLILGLSSSSSGFTIAGELRDPRAPSSSSLSRPATSLYVDDWGSTLRLMCADAVSLATTTKAKVATATTSNALIAIITDSISICTNTIQNLMQAVARLRDVGHFRPGIAQAYGAVEHKPPRRAVGIAVEIALTLELDRRIDIV